ncbi:hypothetical protein CHLRE_07g327500v5 [Chlamydomonas reinhardtii]|uniref:C2 NT-type domain-containing protein n=1 Tax=Chlamydomonas reinhardtii TaxID=3055 RepID=A0A2K3DJN6_CHLRE|nr:uncharacterized protein CHLRE_07g327500v5 [Chlamydomonas reinhardtii]PNW80731.1 hypothetical protein CHLRE_07g327500v5 [Chlamydomonas reinhardtii]
MPLRYELEIIPYLCGDIPDGVSHCSFAWERGSKLFVTEPAEVNAASHAVFWKQYLRQTATMYKEGAELLPKDYAFKVQSVKPGSKAGQEKRKTVGKVHINLAQFCSEALDAQPQEVMLHLKPAGKLKVCIKATWLRNARVDADAMTEVTGASFYADSHYDDDEEGGGEEGYGEEGGRLAEEEQDLSGFDPETGEPVHRKSRRGRGGHGEASTSGQHGEEGEEDQQYDEDGNPILRRNRRGRKGGRRHRSRHGEGIPEDGTFGDEAEGEHGGDEYGDPGGGEHGEGGDGANGEGGRRGRKGPGSRASKGEGRPKLKTYPGSAPPTGPGGLQIEAGRQVHKAGWRDYLCCCLPRRGPSEDPLEGDSLLNKGRLDSSAPAGGAGGGGGGGANGTSGGRR